MVDFNPNFHYLGKPCPKGHTIRYSKNKRCVECLIATSSEWAKQNKERFRELVRKYNKSEKGKKTHSEYKRRYFQEHKNDQNYIEKLRAYRKKYYVPRPRGPYKPREKSLRVELPIEGPVDFDTAVFFLSPDPCPKGHEPAVKRRDNGMCRECVRLKSAEWSAKNLERKRKRNREYMRTKYSQEGFEPRTPRPPAEARESRLAYLREYSKRRRKSG